MGAGGHEGSWGGQWWAGGSYVLHKVPAVSSCEERPCSAVWIQPGQGALLWNGEWPCDEAPKETTGLSHQERSSMTHQPGGLKVLSKSLALAATADKPVVPVVC